MRTRDRIKEAYAAIGTTLEDLVDTHPNYCPTIRETTFAGHGVSGIKALEMAEFAGRAFDAQCVIRGQARRAFAPHNMPRWPKIVESMKGGAE